MKLEELIGRYLPMNRMISYLLLGLTEPIARNELCQTISELSDGEFDDDPSFRDTLLRVADELLAQGLLEELPVEGENTLVTTDAGSKLLVCEFNRRHWLENNTKKIDEKYRKRC